MPDAFQLVNKHELFRIHVLKSKAMPKAKQKTRGSFEHRVLGHPQAFRDDILPTKKEVFLHMLNIRHLVLEGSRAAPNDIPRWKTTKVAVDDVINQWH